MFQCKGRAFVSQGLPRRRYRGVAPYVDHPITQPPSFYVKETVMRFSMSTKSMARVSHRVGIHDAWSYGDLYVHKTQITSSWTCRRTRRQTKTLEVASRRHRTFMCLDASVVADSGSANLLRLNRQLQQCLERGSLVHGILRPIVWRGEEAIR